MTDKEIICAEIEKLRKEYDIDITPISKYQIAQAILNRLSDVIDSLSEEPVRELEKEIDKYAIEHGYISETEIGYTINEQIKDIAHHFAQWNQDKLDKVIKLADAMYNAAFNMTTDASLLSKAMEDYYQFIIHINREE